MTTATTNQTPAQRSALLGQLLENAIDNHSEAKAALQSSRSRSSIIRTNLLQGVIETARDLSRTAVAAAIAAHEAGDTDLELLRLPYVGDGHSDARLHTRILAEHRAAIEEPHAAGAEA